MDLHRFRPRQHNRAGDWRRRGGKREKQCDSGAADGWRCADHYWDCAAKCYDGTLWARDSGLLPAEEEGENGEQDGGRGDCEYQPGGHDTDQRCAHEKPFAIQDLLLRHRLRVSHYPHPVSVPYPGDGRWLGQSEDER